MIGKFKGERKLRVKDETLEFMENFIMIDLSSRRPGILITPASKNC